MYLDPGTTSDPVWYDGSTGVPPDFEPPTIQDYIDRIIQTIELLFSPLSGGSSSACCRG